MHPVSIAARRRPQDIPYTPIAGDFHLLADAGWQKRPDSSAE